MREHLYDLLERRGFSTTAWHLIVEDEDPAWQPDVEPLYLKLLKQAVFLMLQAQACP